MDCRFIEYDYLHKALKDDKNFKLVKNNYKKLLYGNVNVVFIIGGCLVTGCFVALLAMPIGLLITYIFGAELSILVKLLFLCAVIISTYYLGKILFEMVANFSINQILKKISIPKDRNKIFLNEFCNEKKLCKEDLYWCKSAYEKLNIKWKAKSKRKLEVIKIIANILISILLSYFLLPIFNLIIGNIYVNNGLLEMFKNIALLAVIFQSLEVEEMFFSFDNLIERYDYVINFGYDLFERKYK